MQVTKQMEPVETHTCQQVELRRAIRYRLQAPVVFWWEGPGFARFQGEGATRDISTKGAFILTSTCPPVEVIVSIKIFLPPISSGGQHMTLTTEGRVVRVEHGGAGDGFAVSSGDFAIPALARGIIE